ncbi:MAG TPA: hypothetical protein VK469_19625, partial [Candidatus Kapabacteria bacterium]|nr:hypothetical protein [Candidatus Kapabacteria bacterium]
MPEILARQCINPLQFGTLTILGNGHIHANINTPRLGTLARDSIYEVVYKEMDLLTFKNCKASGEKVM